MTQPLYHEDSYIQEFDAAVTAVDAENHGVILDRTAFFPGGGGQPADRGTLTIGEQTYAVKRAQEKERGEAQDATKQRDAAIAALETWLADFKVVARIALQDTPQLLEALNLGAIP